MNELVPYKDLQSMAETVVRSKMFPGISTPESAMALFLLCQSEGLHPMQALTRYHVIQGRPAMKADAMLAEFMRRGGTINWLEWTNDACEAEFVSPGCPQGVKVRWTMDDAKRAGVTGNPTWTKYPRQMLKARVASDGVRMTDPAVNQGRYSPEETRDIIYSEKASLAAPEEPTGPSQLEGQLRRSLGETPEPVRLEGTVAPGHCTLKACGGEIGLFVSTSKAFPGREYWQCEVAHEEKIRLLNEGATNKLANAAVAAHYREWVGPWPVAVKEGAIYRGISAPPSGPDGKPLYLNRTEREYFEGAGDADSDSAADLPPPLPEDAPAPSIFGTDESHSILMAEATLAAQKGEEVLAQGGTPLQAVEAISARIAKKLAKEKAAAK